jgi:hypothetical protein
MAARNPFASSVPDIFDPYALVQTRRPAHSTGYYFIKNLLLVGAVAGGIVALYRNDVFLELARRVGQEQRYLDAEKFLVGTPGWGTPRSMVPVLNHADDPLPATATVQGDSTASAASVAAPASTSGSDTPAPTASPAKAETVAAVAPMEQRAALPAAPAETAPHLAATSAAPVAALAASPARKSADLSPVSFDSLPGTHHGASTRAVAAAEPPPPRPAPVAHTQAPAPVAYAPAPRPAPVDHSHVKAIKVTLDETPEPASHRAVPLPTHAAPPPPEPKPAPKPVAAKPEPPQPKASDVHDGDNPLLAAVRGAVRKHPPKSAVPAAE